MHLLRQLVCRLAMLGSVFRKNGLRAGLAELTRTVSHVLYRRGDYIVMANNLTVELVLPHPQPGLVIRGVTAREELADLSALVDLVDLSRFYRMFERGSHAFIAWQNDQPVGYAWASQVVDRSVHGVQPPLRAGDACLHDLYVSPTHRRQGIGQALIVHRLQFLRDRGCQRAIIAVERDNVPAMKANGKTGYTAVGEISHARFLFWERLTYSALADSRHQETDRR